MNIDLNFIHLLKIFPFKLFYEDSINLLYSNHKDRDKH